MKSGCKGRQGPDRRARCWARGRGHSGLVIWWHRGCRWPGDDCPEHQVQWLLLLQQSMGGSREGQARAWTQIADEQFRIWTLTPRSGCHFREWDKFLKAPSHAPVLLCKTSQFPQQWELPQTLSTVPGRGQAFIRSGGVLTATLALTRKGSSGSWALV